jgi:Fe-S-cluster containining protein
MTKEFSPFGSDLFGDPIQQNTKSVVAKNFILPPFSVLSARDGAWQERKRAWVDIGLKSELGRGTKTGDSEEAERLLLAKSSGTDFYAQKRKKEKELGRELSTADFQENHYEEKSAIDSGTSVFDPVLCELIYTWFSADGWQIVDPFAGGSVRGIVASQLDRKYWGSDLRGEQIEANRTQADEIIGGTVAVKVSAAMLRQKFHRCSPDFVKGTCKGRCCEGTDGIKVTIHSTEAEQFRAKGAKVEDGFIVADERGLCPFKSDEGFCNIHDQKPMGCRFSPFTLNKNGTLVVRNRYRMLKCYSCEGSEPAYKSHAWSLAQLFGESEAARITAHLDDGGDDLTAQMPAEHYAIVCDNDAAKGSIVATSTRPVWVQGDSAKTLADAPKADLVFSCPPYGDLEVYSEDPGDLSNMGWENFLLAYREIISRACETLKENRFACFVVGDFRDPKGYYRNFVSETIAAFESAGAKLYNEAILVTSVGSASMRVTKQFKAGRKFAKTHQNILVFCKGDWRKAVAEINAGQETAEKRN